MWSKKPIRFAVGAAAASMLLVLAGCSSSSDGDNEGADSDGPVQLNIATAGDTNMVDLQKKDAIPNFQKEHPDADINVVGTGPGDAGSIAIYQKLKAEKDAGRDTFDIDVAIVHQSVMKELIDDGLVDQWVSDADNGDMVVSEDAKKALGTDVEGYVAPLFESQAAIAYNSEKVQPFDDYASLVDWIKDNPDRFGYNGVKNGASGVAFVDGWMYWKSDNADQLKNGPYDESVKDTWTDTLKELKALPARITNGNDGTLDLLNRGEIDAGPVWVDMYSSWQDDGRLNPNVKVSLPDPGMPGQPMYIVVTSGAQDREAAVEYANSLISPEFQADVIVSEFSWYPGIDAEKVLPNVSDDVKQQLFEDITPEVLDQRAEPFPLADFKADIETEYERVN